CSFSSVSSALNPARTQKPRPIAPTDCPSTLTEARLTRWMTTLKGRPQGSPLQSSFDRDALGEVAWLVDVAAAADRDVVREQLERDRRQHRREEVHRLGDLDDVIHQRGDGRV